MLHCTRSHDPAIPNLLTESMIMHQSYCIVQVHSVVDDQSVVWISKKDMTSCNCTNFLVFWTGLHVFAQIVICSWFYPSSSTDVSAVWLNT